MTKIANKNLKFQRMIKPVVTNHSFFTVITDSEINYFT